jgi:hypothetical protein
VSQALITGCEVWHSTILPVARAKKVREGMSGVHHPLSLQKVTFVVCMLLNLIFLFLLITITANCYLVPVGVENSFHSPLLPTTNTMTT